jgi:hypothetical protein
VIGTRFTKVTYVRAMSQLSGLVADFLRQRPGFDPSSGRVGFVVDEVALDQAVYG